MSWLTVRRGDLPLLISIPHAGIDVPAPHSEGLISPWLTCKDTDWWIDRLYETVIPRGATVIRTAISRSIIDVNRDPTDRSLYPGLATTGLCPTTTFDGEPLYAAGAEPSAGEIARRREQFHEPYHAALHEEIDRLRESHDTVVVYDCHAIRSSIPRLFSGLLPHFNIGTFDGTSCSPSLTEAIERACRLPKRTRVTNGRFKGGFITRSCGRPEAGVHAVQMEIACRAYLAETVGSVSEADWPPMFDPRRVDDVRGVLRAALEACILFALGGQSSNDGANGPENSPRFSNSSEYELETHPQTIVQ